MRNQGERRVQRKNFSHTSCNILSQAVTDHGVRLEPPSHQQARERVFHNKHCGLGQKSLAQLLRFCAFFSAIPFQHLPQIQTRSGNIVARLAIQTKYDLSEINSQDSLKDLAAIVNLLAEGSL